MYTIANLINTPNVPMYKVAKRTMGNEAMAAIASDASAAVASDAIASVNTVIHNSRNKEFIYFKDYN